MPTETHEQVGYSTDYATTKHFPMHGIFSQLESLGENETERESDVFLISASITPLEGCTFMEN